MCLQYSLDLHRLEYKREMMNIVFPRARRDETAGYSGVSCNTWLHALRRGVSVGAVDRAELDVRIDDLGAGVVGLNIAWDTGRRGAGAASNTGRRGCLVERVVAVKPEHVGLVVIPDGQHECARLAEQVAETAVVLERCRVAERRLLRAAIGRRDRVLSTHAGDVVRRVGDELAILNVEATNLSNGRANELRDDGELGGSVNRLARTVETGIALAVGVEVAPIGVALRTVSVGCATARCRVALDLTRGIARVRSEGVGDAVGLPDVHLRAARAQIAGACVGIVRRRDPARNIALAINELDVTRALRVAVSGTVCRASLVVRVLGLATIGVHLDEVESAVQAARKLRDIHVERKLLVWQGEHMVVGTVVQKVHARADVLCGVRGDELQREGISGRRDAIGVGVIRAFEHTGLRADRVACADRGIPSITSVTVSVTASGVDVSPSPVSVKRHGASGSRATGVARTSLPGQGRVGLRLVGANTLSGGESRKSE